MPTRSAAISLRQRKHIMTPFERVLQKAHETGDFRLAYQLATAEERTRLAEHYRPKQKFTFQGIDEYPSQASTRRFIDAHTTEFTKHAAEVLDTMDFSKIHIPGPLLLSGSEQKLSKRAADEELFATSIASDTTKDFDWDIFVYADNEDRYFVELYQTERFSAGTADKLVAVSQPFKRCQAAVLWAHKFEVPVFVTADDLYPEDED